MRLSSRERMLAALSCQPVDYPPCCFMQFTALEDRCQDQFEMVERQLAWGLDVTVQVPPWLLTVPGDYADLRGLPVRFHPDVQVKEWIETEADERYPVLGKEYVTPGGSLSVQVSKTGDWPYGNHIPFLDDFIIPRALKPLISSHSDLETLRYLLVPPAAEIIREFQESAHRAKAFAGKHDLLVSGGVGVGADMAGWLCGLENLIFLAVDEPVFVDDLMQLISSWSLQRMEIVLEAGINLWVRRGWYESCDFWSPRLYRRFILPHLKREVELAHSHGVMCGYILTSGVMPLLDMLLEAQVDALIGVDPLMGDVNLNLMQEKLGTRMCLWGGVNGPISVEKGDPEEVRMAVKNALDILNQENGFILSPVDEIDDSSEHAWNNVQVFIEAWKEYRSAS